MSLFRGRARGYGYSVYHPRVQTPPAIGISLGDPAGIGPEIVDTLLVDPRWDRLEVTVFGHASLLPRARGKKGLTIVEPPGSIDVVPGRPDSASAAAQVAYLELAAEALHTGAIAGIATAPINKHEAAKAGFAFPGHTEFFASLGGRVAPRPVTMSFLGPRLRVALATAHVSLRGAIETLEREPENITRAAIDLATVLAANYRIAQPRIAIAGLNPHAGEHGAFGHEEARFVDAIADAQRACPFATIVGPVVPDVVFRQALVRSPEQRWDGVVALYHDQALIPVKLLDFDHTVNVTLGLPFVRTSPDHGTAYDIAGKGIARADSMMEALALCWLLVHDEDASIQAFGGTKSGFDGA